MICEALANEYSSKLTTIKINSSEIFSKFFGETEKNLQEYFQRAFENHPKPTLILIENIQNLCPKNETTEILNRVSLAFMNLLDSLQFNDKANKLFILATCGNIENLNPGIRRCGRFDTEIRHSTEDLCKLSHNLTDESIKDISNVTHGYVASDLANLVHSAALKALNESRERFTDEDISYALTQVKPSAMREVLIESPNVSWEDIGGQEDLKLKLKQAIEWPLLYPEKFKKMGIKPPRGILMFGPPGCSKTMIAKALATESKVNFLSIKGPELFSMWVGESERAVREVFRKARQVAPSIIFFDEIDAIGGERSSENGSVKERVLTQLLTELDGVDTLKDVTIVAATNRPDMMDKALMRPGRIDRIVYVSLPDESTRREIFRIKLKRMPVADEVSIDSLVEKTKGYSGAEIQAICQEAALKTLDENIEAKEVTWKHFEYALSVIQPRTSPQLLKTYDEYIKQC
uniref:AAA+ ATPase domain-containing protein n=1 Tax=Megaselia scalaris TaxID=36166 RepID=T1GNG7_MEGSC